MPHTRRRITAQHDSGQLTQARRPARPPAGEWSARACATQHDTLCFSGYQQYTSERRIEAQTAASTAETTETRHTRQGSFTWPSKRAAPVR